MSEKDLARRLEGIGYIHLFNEIDDAERRKIWATPGMENQLRALLADKKSSPVARFLAAELLASRSDQIGSSPQTLADVYVEGLKHGASQVGNPWGLPGQVGALSQRVLDLGTVAEASLRSALDNRDPLPYMGSQEATLGNAYNWRVKDQAAQLLMELRGESFEPDRDPKKRDEAIERLRATAARGDGG